MRALVLLVGLAGCAHDKQPWPVAKEAATPVPVTPPAPPRVTSTREPRAAAAGGRICAWPTEPVRLDLVRADVRQVLQALADRGRLNLVLADEVHGEVTVRLDGVPLHEALVTIANAAGVDLDTEGCITVATRPRP